MSKKHMIFAMLLFVEICNGEWSELYIYDGYKVTTFVNNKIIIIISCLV